MMRLNHKQQSSYAFALFVLLLTAGLFVFQVKVSFAGWEAPEFLVNAESELDQAFPQIDDNAGGRFVITWHAQGVDADGYAIAARVFDAPANPAGTQFQVNTTETGEQLYPDVAVFSTGGFVISWCSGNVDGNGYGVVAQRFDNSANKVGSEFVVNSTIAQDQYSPVVASDGADRFIIAWVANGQDGDGEGIFGQRFDETGNPEGAEFQINTYTTDEQSAPTISADNAGRFAVAWQSWEQDTSDYGIYCRLYDASGTPLGSDFRVNLYTPVEQSWPELAMEPSGNFFAIWQSDVLDGSGYGVFTNLFDTTGTHQLGVEFQVNSEIEEDQQFAAIDSVDGLTWIAVWQSRHQDKSGQGVYAQRFDSAGSAIGSEARVNAFVKDDQRFPKVIAQSDGGYVVVWNSQQTGSNDYDVVARRIEPCVYNSDCSDGLYCNGEESCDAGMCVLGNDPCDDDLFCNGKETCEESTQTCDSPGDPCQEGETCNEETDECESVVDDDDNDNDDDPDDDDDDDNDNDDDNDDDILAPANDEDADEDSCCCGS